MKYTLLPISFYLVAIFLFATNTSFSQSNPTFIIDDQEVMESETFDVSIKSVNFNELLGVQFSVQWDPTVIQFQGISDFGLSGLSLDGNFGQMQTSAGKLGFFWYDVNVSGVTMPDTASLFTISFTAIGDGPINTAIDFGNIPTMIEVADDSGVLENDRYNGVITILQETSTSLYNSAPEIIEVKQCYPNPFSEYSTLSFNLSQSTQADLMIVDEQGRVVYKEKKYLTAGEQTHTFSSDNFPSAGIYYYKLVSPLFEVSQKLIFMK